ncbi:MAG: alanine racemase, partial [Plesiomonas sp.]
NVSQQASKSGVDFAQIQPLADLIATLPHLQLRGLMTIPEETATYDEQYAEFARLQGAFEQLKLTHPEVDTLSMGMSGDLDAAIAAGSTLVRIGTAIFGAREYPV